MCIVILVVATITEKGDTAAILCAYQSSPLLVYLYLPLRLFRS